MKLNLGAGSAPLKGWVNVDCVQLCGIDVVHDLDTGPWPWPDDSVQAIEAIDVFEHVADPLLFVNECWRILRAGRYAHILVPDFRGPNAFTDPTHRRFCTPATFNYWLPGTWLYEHHGAAYGGHDHSFDLTDLTLKDESLHFTLKKIPPAGYVKATPGR
jgi:SAM-dependent methyltransferase